MASPEVAEVPSKSAHAAMATVMARILAGSGAETSHNRTATEEETQRETQTRTERRKLQSDTLEPNSHSRFWHGDAGMSSGSESDYKLIL